MNGLKSIVRRIQIWRLRYALDNEAATIRFNRPPPKGSYVEFLTEGDEVHVTVDGYPIKHIGGFMKVKIFR